MDDMTAFEHQIGTVLDRMGGPKPAFDAMAIANRAVTSTPTGRWSSIARRVRGGTTTPMEAGFSMFSALKFIAAGVIVALFGGFLLAGVLTTPQPDEVAPAAVTESPTPGAVASGSPEPAVTSVSSEAPTTSVVRSDILPGVALTVEEVKPGVYRVISDGVRDVASRHVDVESDYVRVGGDGSVWSFITQPVKGFFRLGDEQTHAWPLERLSQLEVAPDGMVWTFGGPEGRPRRLAIRSFDGDAWTVHRQALAEHWPGGRPLAVAPDGTVWAAWWDGDEKRSLVVARLGPEGWQPLGPPLERKGDDVALFPTDDGLRVVQTDEQKGGRRKARTYRYDDGAWQRMGPVAREAAIGRDGTIWQYRLALDEAGKRLYGSGGSLARFDGIEWEEFDWQGIDDGPWELTVAADGSLWIDGHAFVCDTQPCDAVARFDGVRWDHFLPGLYPSDVRPDADGAVWLVASKTWFRPYYHLYVITPEAMTATN
jgi:hypothetical protein